MIHIDELIKSIDVISYMGKQNKAVVSIGKLGEDNGSDFTLFWCKESNQHMLKSVEKGTIIISDSIPYDGLNPNCLYIKVANPRKEFMKIMRKFFNNKPIFGVSKLSSVDKSVTLYEEVFVGNFVTIEEGCYIGNNVYIQHNTVIHKGTVIGNNVYIGANSTIGGVGFGYAKDDDGSLQEIPHIGNVIIDNNVDIGNNTCIDRAIIGSTTIGRNTKIDNLVHIAHGVTIGKNCAIIANAMIAGSVRISDNSWVAPSASVLNQKRIGSNVVIGLGAVVIKDVLDNDVVVGNPSKSIKK